MNSSTSSSLLAVVHASTFLDRAFAGCNPENADVSNPDGAYYETVVAVQAEAPSGRRFVLNHQFGSTEAADATVARIREAGKIDSARWTETFPRYGSRAWAAEEGHRRLDLADAVRRGDAEAIERLA
jgi:hypothetical protein